jgi:hypothetical protein
MLSPRPGRRHGIGHLDLAGTLAAAQCVDRSAEHRANPVWVQDLGLGVHRATLSGLSRRSRAPKCTARDGIDVVRTVDDALPLIPRDVLFGNPERISPVLSPDGTQASSAQRTAFSMSGSAPPTTRPRPNPSPTTAAAESEHLRSATTTGRWGTSKTPTATRTGACTGSTWVPVNRVSSRRGMVPGRWCSRTIGGIRRRC